MSISILHIETSTKVCSVALSRQQEVLFSKQEFTGPSHAILLGQFIKEAVDFSKKNALPLDAVAVSAGPGSYTGLRIGVSAAKGLCYGLGIPLIALPTLQVLAQAAVNQSIDARYFCPMIDARRMEVYAAVYTKDLEELHPVVAEVVTDNSFISFRSTGKTVFFGNGSNKCKEVLSGENAIFVEDVYPLASNMAALAESAYKKQEFQDVAYFEPFYLKEFQATTPKNKI